MNKYFIAQSGPSRDRGSIFSREEKYIFLKESRPTLGLIQPLIQCVARNIRRVVQLTIYLYLIARSESVQRHFQLHMWCRA
jgi:hypothetical protein